MKGTSGELRALPKGPTRKREGAGETPAPQPAETGVFLHAYPRAHTWSGLGPHAGRRKAAEEAAAATGGGRWGAGTARPALKGAVAPAAPDSQLQSAAEPAAPPHARGTKEAAPSLEHAPAPVERGRMPHILARGRKD